MGNQRQAISAAILTLASWGSATLPSALAQDNQQESGQPKVEVRNSDAYSSGYAWGGLAFGLLGFGVGYAAASRSRELSENE